MRQVPEARTAHTATPSSRSASTPTIDKVTDPGEIAAWGVMATPALVVDDRVVAAGRVPSAADLTAMLVGTT